MKVEGEARPKRYVRDGGFGERQTQPDPESKETPVAVHTEYTRHTPKPGGWRAHRDGGVESIHYHDSVVMVT